MATCGEAVRLCVEGDLLRFICPDLRGGWFWGAVVLVRLWWGLWLWLLLEGREREERQGFFGGLDDFGDESGHGEFDVELDDVAEGGELDVSGGGD